MTERKTLDLPSPPKGHYWSVKQNMYTSSPYLHLMREVNLYLFKFGVTVRKKYIPFGEARIAVRIANEIIDEFSLYGDYR